MLKASVRVFATAELRESIRSGKQAIELLRGLDDPQAEAYVLTSVAESHHALGHLSSALSCLKRSLRLRRRIGDSEGEIGALYDISGVYEEAVDQLPGVRWIRFYYSAEEGKLYCEYEAPSVELVYEHARLADLPVDKCAVVRELEPSMFR